VSKLNLALYFETGDESLLPPVKPGDTIYVPDKNRIWLDQSKESTVRVLGAVNKPGRYRFNDTMTLLDLLAEAGGPSPDAYVEKITVVNLSCCRDQARSFDLAEFSRTASFEDLPVLRVGDTVYIPSKSESTMAKIRTGLNDVFQITAFAALLGFL
jgi:protein involved in polysaccharide export with SLBB domain